MAWLPALFLSVSIVCLLQPTTGQVKIRKLREILSSQESIESASIEIESQLTQQANPIRRIPVNYQTIQSSIISSLQSSSSISGISSGIITSQDVAGAFVRALTSAGVQSGIAQSVASSTLSSIRVGSSSQSVARTLANAVIQALSRSDVVSNGQEILLAQRISLSITSYLNLIVSQKSRPAPAS